MEYPNIPYRSFCWTIGTTSFRTDKLNFKIELQLKLLSDFKKMYKKEKAVWDWNENLQTQYYDYMHEQEFLVGSAKRKAKDAREKTSSLVEIGLLDNQRNLTSVGEELLELSLCGEFPINNDFQLPADSYIYFKQLLKTQQKISNETIRPFIIFAYLISELGYLTNDEFTYLMPLCIDKKSLLKIKLSIIQLRKNKTTIDEIIIDMLLSMDNYKEALNLFLDTDISEQLVCTVGFNRKSRSYDKIYYKLYNSILNYLNDKSDDNIIKIYESTRKINGKVGTAWRAYLFNTSSSARIKKNPSNSLNDVEILESNSEEDLKINFFKLMHLYKAKATLNDYFDLNRRYFKITDIVLFDDGIVRFDIIPKYFFENISEQLFNISFEEINILSVNVPIIEISKYFVYDKHVIIKGIERDYGIKVSNFEEALTIVKDERYKRFNYLIDSKFDDKTLLYLLDMFEKRNDKEISRIVTDNADIPTIFEYVLGVIWYKLSDRKGDILSYMNLSLEANLLPKTHAAGGEADVEYYYPKTKYYPEHYLLLEATLSLNTGQRVMEMEPVTRHLGEHLLKTNNNNSYCIFVSTKLHVNLVSDFRSRKTYPYYDTKDWSRVVNGMKIIPLSTKALKGIIKTGKQYPEIYKILDDAHKEDDSAPEWYSRLEDTLISYHDIQVVAEMTDDQNKS